jgi:hypothetical protein
LVRFEERVGGRGDFRVSKKEKWGRGDRLGMGL